MKKNIGSTDRLLRFVISCLFFALAYWYESWILLAAAIFTLYESLASWCVMYQILGKNSCPIDENHNKKP